MERTWIGPHPHRLKVGAAEREAEVLLQDGRFWFCVEFPAQMDTIDVIEAVAEAVREDCQDVVDEVIVDFGEDDARRIRRIRITGGRPSGHR